MEKGLKEYVKMMVNSLLVPHAKGLVLHKLLKEYEEQEGKLLPFRKLGFNSPAEFMYSIPDVVRCVQLPSGHLLLQAVANQNVSHIQEYVRGQKNTNATSVRHLNNLLRRQNTSNHQRFPTTNRSYTNYPPPNYDPYQPRPSFQPQKPLVNGSGQNHGSETSDLSQGRAFQSLMYEVQLVTELKELLQNYPNGVNIEDVFDLYVKKYNKPIALHKIEDDLTTIEFMKKHSGYFVLANTLKGVTVSLSGISSETQVQPSTNGTPNTSQRVETCSQSPPKADTYLNTPQNDNVNSYTGAIPKRPSPQALLPPPEAMPRSTINQPPVQPKDAGITWTSRDVRFRSPNANRGSSSVSTFAQPNGTASQQVYRTGTPASTYSDTPRLPGQSRNQTENVPASFGAARPKLKDIYTPNTTLSVEVLPPEAETGYFFIIVSEVYSPGKFYWFLSSNHKAIKSLTDDMVLFYNINEEYHMNRNEIYIGQIVAAMYTDNLWYRARIVGVHRDDFQVFYIDYGSGGTVPIHRLRHLHLQFTKLPVQAFRGRIFGINHLAREKKWSIESGKRFLDMIKGNKVIAAAKMMDETVIENNETFEVRVLLLVDTNGNKDLHFADYLVENGFAVVNEDDFNAVQPEVCENFYTPISDASLHNENLATQSVEYSPLPTVPFPTSVITNDHSSDSKQVTSRPAPKQPLSTDLLLAELGSKYTASITPQQARDSVKEISESRCIKRLALSDGRVIYILKHEKELYLPSESMLMLVPRLESHLAALKMKVDVKVIDADKDPHIFLDCVRLQVPWINGEDGQLRSELILYPLKHVNPILYLCGVKDPVAAAAINDQFKNCNESFSP